MDTVSEPPTLGSTTEPESPKHFDTPAISVSDDKTSMLLQPNTVGSKIVVSEEELNRVNDLERKNEPTIRSPSPPHIAKYEFLTSLDDRPRLSSQSAHPSPSDLYESSLYGFKPKLKLGPRPSLDTKKRPNASGPNGWAGSRPVSTLPAGLKMFPKKTAEPSRNLQNPHRQKSVAEKPKNDGAPVPQPPPPPIPDVPSFTIPSPRPTSRGSTKSMPSSISPEKKRLMKALALRKKQMAAAKTRVPETSTPEVNNSESVVGGKDDPIGRRSSEGHLNSFYARAKADSGAELTSENEPHLEPGKITQNFQDEYNAESSTPLQSELNRSRETDALPHDSHHEDVASGDVLKNGPLTSSGSNSVGEQVLSDTGSQITDRPKTAIQREDDADAFGEESAPVKESEDTEDLVLIPGPSEGDLTAVNLRQKRRGIVKPIQIHVTGDNSDADYLSDDSFMEELQSAKVEEAKSLPISKSPATPIFSRRPSSISANSGTPRPGSYVSSEKTEKQKHRTPTPEPPKTSQERSSPISAQHKSQEAANVSRQRTVSSDISKRIQALAQHSHHQRLPAGVHPAINTDSSSTFLTLRKHALRNQSQADLASSPKIQKTTSSSGDSRTMSYEQRQTTYQVHHKQGRPESISVTARIVRDPQMQKSEFSAPTENGPLALYQSPLIINHQKSGTPIANFSSPSMGSTPPSSFPPKQNPQRNDPLHASSSEQSNRGSSSNAAPRASESSRRSFARSRHSSDLKSSPSTARSQSNSSLASDDRPQDSSVDANAGKRKSRTSRLFKRMSNSMTSANSHRRRSLAAIMSPTASDTLEEENRPPLEDSVEPLVEEQMLGSGTGWTPVEVGDLNVQFPDTLLWKRRWVEIDAQGFLVLGLSRANGVRLQTSSEVIVSNVTS